ALYNPKVGANIMSTSFVLTHLGENPLAPTNKTFWIAPCSIIEGVGIMHKVPIWHENIEVALDFHIFEVYDFNILIGHPIEKLFLDAPILGTLN
uniref:Uncharacterized protein n=1 Tax=Setaria italica TaxID=4555 RepID=K3ZZS9_SETIT